MPQMFNNNAVGVLAATKPAGATSLQLAPGQGARFPQPAIPSDFFALTLFKIVEGAEASFEIVRCTARNSDFLTIVGAQEGTPPTTFAAGDQVSMRVTAEYLNKVTAEVVASSARHYKETNAVFIFDGESTNSPAAGGTGWVEVVMNLSFFKDRGTPYYVAEPGRNMANTFAEYAENVRPLIQAAVAAGKTAYVFLQSGLNDYGLRSASEWFVPFDQYVSAVRADGGILVPMLCTRRIDWSAFDGTRQSINQHILELGIALTVPTDSIFTDPSFVGPSPQSDDGVHPNAGMNGKIAIVVNEVMSANSGFAHVPTVSQKRSLAPSEVPYINALGQLSTDGGLTMELATGPTKNIGLTLSNPFSVADETYIQLRASGNFRDWRISAVGDTGLLPPELGSSLVVYDKFTGRPLIAMSVYNQASTLYENWGIKRGGVGSTREPIVTQVAYPTTNTTPGVVGQIAVSPDKTKFAIYSGDGTTHSWCVTPATSIV